MRPSAIKKSTTFNPKLSSLSDKTPKRDKLPVIFNTCDVGVVFRAIFLTHTITGIALSFYSKHFTDWSMQLSFLIAGLLPSVLLWLVIVCFIKDKLSTLPRIKQYSIMIGLGALMGILACGILQFIDPTGHGFWFPSILSGAAFSTLLIMMLELRANAQAPATTAARLQELQSRIRPHFLFNTLNSAIVLIQDSPRVAENLLQDLSDLFRFALTEQGAQTTLEQEITLAKNYLNIEQVRFGERLKVIWKIDEKAQSAQLPPLILQPLIENAVRHGVEPNDQGGVISIRTQRRGGSVLISIDNTVEEKRQKQDGHGIALKNVEQRLYLLHDLHANFKAFLDEKAHMYHIRIEIPLASMPTVVERKE